MNDERLDREIKAALTAREPGPVPATLRARIAAIPATTRASRWPRPVEVLRGGLRLAAATAAIALVVAVADYGFDRVTSGVGTPPGAAADAAPFIVDGAGLFSSGAIADANARLGTVFAATRVEATLITQHESADSQLSTPEGFPEQYDRDRSDGRDVIEVVGVAPSGTISCCLTITGPVIDQAADDQYWPPLTRVPTLTALFASTDPAERDTALGRFVGGVERLSTKVGEVAESMRTGEAIRTGILGGSVGAIGLVTWWLVRRRPGSTGQRISPTGADVVEDGVVVDLPEAEEPAPTVDPTAIRWPRIRASRPGRRELVMAVAAAVAFGAFLVQGLVLAPVHGPSRPLDLSATGFGVAAPASPVLALGMLVATLALLMILAARIGRAGWAILGLVVIGILAIALTVVNLRPVAGSGSATGLGFERRESAGPQGIFAVDYYPVGADEPFTFSVTIRNPGPLPMTILGLAETFTKPGPGFVPGLEIVGLGTRGGSTINGIPGGAAEFEPVRLATNEQVQLIVVGRGGTCAAGSLEAMESVAILTHLPIAYSVLGANRVVEMDLPATVMVPTLVASCEP
jgi:hypothetical protein